MFLTEISNRNQTKPNISFKTRVNKVKMHQTTGGFTVIFPKIIYTPNIYFRNTKTCRLCYCNLPKCVLYSHQALCKLSAYYNSWNLYPHPSFNIIDKGIFRLKRVSLFIHPSGSIRHEQKFPSPSGEIITITDSPNPCHPDGWVTKPTNHGPIGL